MIASITKKSFKDFFTKPLVIFYSACILVSLLLFDVLLSVKIAQYLNGKGEFLHYFALIIYSLLKLFIISIFTILIIKTIYGAKNGFRGSLKLIFQNYLILILFIFLYGITQIVNWGVYYLAKAISLPSSFFTIATVIIQVSGLLFLLTPVSFAPFFLVKSSKGLVESIKLSIIFSKISYLYVLFVFILFILLMFLMTYVPNPDVFVFTLHELIEYIVLYPLLSIWLANLINE